MKYCDTTITICYVLYHVCRVFLWAVAGWLRAREQAGVDLKQKQKVEEVQGQIVAKLG